LYKQTSLNYTRKKRSYSCNGIWSSRWYNLCSTSRNSWQKTW